MKRAGIVDKKSQREARKYCNQYPKCNRRYAIENFAFAMNFTNGWFAKYSSKIQSFKSS